LEGPGREQAALGCMNVHLHEFQIGELSYGAPADLGPIVFRAWPI
jgi:hypothetical protein